MLTTKELDSVKVTNKPQKLFDGDGLYLYIPAKPLKGKVIKKWCYYFYFWDVTSKKTKQAVYKGWIGEYPATTLAEARRIKDELKKVKNPNDVYEELDKERIESQLKTFGEVVELWFEEYQRIVAESTIEKVEQRMRAHIRKHENYNKKLCDIRTKDIADHLKTVNAPTAEKLKAIYNATFKYAREYGYSDRDGKELINPTPKDALLRHKAHKEKKYPGITDERKLAGLIRAIYGYECKIVRGALFFLLHCGTRGGDMRNIKWENIDWDNKVINVEKTKNNHPFVVPMSRQVENMLLNIKEQRRCEPDPEEYVFHREGMFKSRMSNMTTNSALRRLGYDTIQEHTSHGFRTTFSTLAHEKWDKEIGYGVIEQQIDHKSHTTAVSRIYNESEHLDDRRVLMQKWSDYIDELAVKKFDN